MLTRAVGAVAIAVRIFERVQNVAQLVGLGYAVAASADSIVVNSGRPVEGL
jgi:cation/acetate symporter